MANDANIIKIKRSGTSGAPASLKLGELAYSYLTASGNPTSNGGDRLFIGANGVSGVTGNANDVIVIGGKYFTDLLDHERGILTAGSALIVDADKKLDELLVDNLSLNGDTLSATGTLKLQAGTGNIIEVAANNVIAGGAFGGSQLFLDSGNVYLKQLRSGNVNLVVGADGTATSTLTFNNDGSLTVPGTIKTLSNGNLTLSPNGTGLVSIAGAYTLPRVDGATGYVLTTDGSGVVSWAAASSSLSIAGTTGTDSVSLLNDTLTFAGGTTPVTIAVTDNTVTIDVADATASTKGLASFDSTNFTVTGGAVVINDEYLQDTIGTMVSTNTENGISVTYDDATGKLDFDVSDFTLTIDGDVDGSATVTNLGNTTVTVTLDTVNSNVGSFGSTSKIPTFTVNGKGLLTAAGEVDVATNLLLAGDTGTDTVSLLSDTLTVAGGEGIDTVVTDNTITISAEIATSSNLGVASFATSGFVVTSGDVVLKGDVAQTVTGDSGTATPSTNSFKIAGTSAQGITTSATGSIVTVTASDATASQKGVASFDSTDFTVTIGAVTLNAERVEDIVGAMVSTNTEDGIAVTYDDTTGKLNFNVNDPVITIDGDVDGSATITNLGDTTITVTLDTVNTDVGSFGSATAIPVVTVNGKGLVTAVTTANIATSLSIAGTSGTDTVSLLSDTLSFLGATTPITVAVTDNTVTVAVADATTTTKGLASFATDTFSVSSGAVDVKTGGISNTQLANSSVTFGTTNVALGSSSLSLAGLQQVDVDNIQINGNEISTTDTNGNLSLNPNGTGTVDVNSSRITGLAEPVDATDAATKAYVDAARSGLDVKQSVRAATTGAVTLSNTQTIDGVALSVGDRVLVKDQADAALNGVYVVSGSTWSRATDFDEPYEVTAGVFFFVEEGTVNADAGFVITSDNPQLVGTDPLTFTQFSGAGQIVAGDALSKTGNRLDVVVAASGGIEISADALQLKSTLAGNGLTYASGVLDIVGTANRISISADAIDIDSNYVGQSSITTLGTITTGTWNAGVLTYAYGGTGQSTYAKGDILYASGTNTLSKLTAGANGQMLQLQDGVPTWAELDGGTY